MTNVWDMATVPFTLTLDEVDANRIAAQVKPFGGTVPGFAREFTVLISRLPLGEQEAIRAQIDTRIKQLEAAGILAAPRIPAVPHQPTGEAKMLLAQVSPQLRPTHKRQSRRGTRTGKGSMLPAGA